MAAQLSVAVFAVLVSTGTCADDTPVTDASFKGSGGFNPDTFGVLPRLRNPVVLDLLEVTPEQRKDLNAVQRQWLTEFKRFVDLPAADRRAARDSLDQTSDRFEQASLDVLTPAQRSRIESLRTVDYFHPPALRDLLSTTIRQELQLEATQIDATKALYAKYLTDGEAFLLRSTNRNSSGAQLLVELEPFRLGFEQHCREFVAKNLTEKQQHRLAEIQLQGRCVLDGPRVLLERDVSNHLRLTAEQQAQIRKLDDELSSVPSEKKSLFGPHKYYLRARGLLSQEQLKHWREMLGPPFQKNIDIVPADSTADEP